MRKAHRRRPAIFNMAFFNGCSVFSPSSILAFLAIFGIDSILSYRPPKDGMSQPGYFLAAGFDWRFVHILVFDLICGGERASERLEEETHVWDDSPSL
jgi:hypothetical protein